MGAVEFKEMPPIIPNILFMFRIPPHYQFSRAMRDVSYETVMCHTLREIGGPVAS